MRASLSHTGSLPAPLSIHCRSTSVTILLCTRHKRLYVCLLPFAVFCLLLSAEEAQIEANIDEGRHKCESLSLYEAHQIRCVLCALLTAT